VSNPLPLLSANPGFYEQDVFRFDTFGGSRQYQSNKTQEKWVTRDGTRDRVDLRDQS